MSAATPWRSSPLPPLLLLLALLASGGAALALGRYPVPFGAVAAYLTGAAPDAVGETAWQVIHGVRGPRILLAMVVGCGLALAGAALQAVFRNPLADPQILGVSSGAALGGVLVLLAGGGSLALMGGAFLGGLLTLAAVLWLAGRHPGEGGTVMLVLAGLVLGAVGAAGVALAKYAADPDNQLPAMVFWLLGSLTGADAERLLITTPCVALAALLLLGLRFHLFALSVGETDARALGVPVVWVRRLTLGATGLATAAAVASCGVVGWVGLVVPHLVRLGLGNDHRWFLVNTGLAGATYLVLVDTLARTLTAAELPLGALTALLGAPLFAFLIRQMRGDHHG